jgi:hypothetical protein
VLPAHGLLGAPLTERLVLGHGRLQLRQHLGFDKGVYDQRVACAWRVHGVCMAYACACAWRALHLGPELGVVQLDAGLLLVGGEGRLREGRREYAKESVAR